MTAEKGKQLREQLDATRQELMTVKLQHSFEVNMLLQQLFAARASVAELEEQLAAAQHEIQQLRQQQGS
jgi:chromosome segregation ATPase